ncbi:MAG: hypothetical protein ACK40O_03175 [Allosphingosinicella sp.]
MKKIILAGAAALTLVGTASAQQPSQAPAGDITRAAAIADAERRFAQLDADGNGTLEAAEMRQAFEQRRAERRQRMEARLSAMSPEERAQFEQRRAGRGGKEGARRGGGREGGKGMSRRGDGGPVTLAQFRARAEQRFDRLDLDGNGVITAAEQAELRAKRGARGK